MVEELSAYYQDPFPERVPVDVVGYASWGGANTLVSPLHVMISSENRWYRGAAALEMVFHESSHLLFSATGGTIGEALTAAADSLEVSTPRDLWHAVLFYTAGKTTERVLAEAGSEGYVPYMYAKGVFTGYHAALEEHWQPYLDGDVGLATAAARIVAATGEPRTAESGSR